MRAAILFHLGAYFRATGGSDDRLYYQVGLCRYHQGHYAEALAISGAVATRGAGAVDPLPGFMASRGTVAA